MIQLFPLLSRLSGLASVRSPWYPTLQLIRQKAEGDWSGALTRARNVLAQLNDCGRRFSPPECHL